MHQKDFLEERLKIFRSFSGSLDRWLWRIKDLLDLVIIFCNCSVKCSFYFKSLAATQHEWKLNALLCFVQMPWVTKDYWSRKKQPQPFFSGTFIKYINVKQNKTMGISANYSFVLLKPICGRAEFLICSVVCWFLFFCLSSFISLKRKRIACVLWGGGELVKQFCRLINFAASLLHFFNLLTPIWHLVFKDFIWIG